ncbi:MAG: hypothetical protein ACI9T7_000513 [Oleiphilaceae bacterium]|jgi:hypothetical protein
MIDRHKNKKERIQLRVVPMHKSLLRGKARLCNMSLSDYMVRCGLQQHISPPKSKINQEYVRELSRIGNNINQIAYALNRNHNNPGPLPTADQLQQIVDELKQIRKAI